MSEPTPNALNCDPCYGTLSVNGILLATPAWCLTDMSTLWAGPARRGADVTIPGVDGAQPQRRRAAGSHYSLPLLVTGQVNEVGLSWRQGFASAEEQLEYNWHYLQTYVLLSAIDSVSPLVSLVWTLPSSTTRFADGIVEEPLSVQLADGGTLRTTLELTVPGGDLRV